MQNTKEKGEIEFVIYYDFAEKHFVGVCLTFNIVIEGVDSVSMEQELREAANRHVQTVREGQLPDTLLNRSAPKLYWDIYHEAQKWTRDAVSSEGQFDQSPAPMRQFVAPSYLQPAV